MVNIDEIIQFLSPIIPFAEVIILTIIPIYLNIGGFFAMISLWIWSILPDPLAFQIIFIILGSLIAILGGYLGIKKKKQQDEL